MHPETQEEYIYWSVPVICWYCCEQIREHTNIVKTNSI